MRKLSLILALVFSVGLLSVNAQSVLPDVDIKTLDGQNVSIQDFAKDGKITVISFWATWCGPCKKELDAIADLYEEWQEDYDMELVAVTIDTRRALAKVKPMIEQKGWDYTILSDANGDLKNALNFNTIPQTLLLDQSGDIVYVHNGYVPGDEYELEEKIKALATSKK